MSKCINIFKATATFWAVSSATFLALGITLVPLVPAGWQVTACIGVGVVALLGITRDTSLALDRKALQSSASAPFDKWKNQFDTLNASYHSQKIKIKELAEEWEIAASKCRYTSDPVKRKVLRAVAKTARKDWQNAVKNRAITSVELQTISENLARLTQVVLTIEEPSSPKGNTLSIKG